MWKGTNRLRVLRAERRLTQEDVEARTRNPKVLQSKLSLIENDHIEPTQAERRSIARALRVTVEEAFPLQEERASA